MLGQSFRNLIAIGFMTFSCAIASAQTAQPIASSCINPTEIPFPWAIPVVLPINSLQGVWRAKLLDVEYFFSFRLERDLNDGVPRVEILVFYDEAHTQLAAVGYGYSHRAQTEVWADLAWGHRGYSLTVNSYVDTRCDEAEPMIYVKLNRINDYTTPPVGAILGRISHEPVILSRY